MTPLTTPLTIYDYDVRTGERTLLKREPVLGDFDPANYTSELLWAPDVQHHRGDRPLGHHHGPQHRGFGLEVLGWDVRLGLGHLSLAAAARPRRAVCRLGRGEPHRPRMRPVSSTSTPLLLDVPMSTPRVQR